MDMTELGRTGLPAEASPPAFMPNAPLTPEETGLPPSFLNELMLRHLYSVGDVDLQQLAFRMRLPSRVVRLMLQRLRSAKLIEPLPLTLEAGNPLCSLSDSGRARAAEALSKSRYAGPAPVPLEHYRDGLARQELDLSLDRSELVRAFDELALDDRTLDSLGTALTSGRSFIVHGPPGSGRSSLVGRLAAVARGTVWVPHALLLGDQVLQVTDPAIHLPELAIAALPRSASPDDAPSVQPSACDPRWSLCRRPFVLVGSDAGPGVFEPQPQPEAGSLAAPLQVKAALGTLVIDDAGQGRAASLAMLRRIAPVVERGSDRLALPDGRRVDVPVRLRLVAVGSKAPHQGGYQRWGARFGHHVAVEPLSVSRYREAAYIAAQRLGVQCDESAVDALLRCHQDRGRIPRLASIPLELFSRIADRARWLGQPLVVDAGSVEAAWQDVFGRTHSEASR